MPSQSRLTARFRRLQLLACACLLAPGLQAAMIAPADPRLRYVGHFDQDDPAGPRCAWSASTVAFTVGGGSVRVKFEDGGKNRWQVAIDGAPASVLSLTAGEQTYTVAENLPEGAHLVELVKCTEAFIGATRFLGLEVDDPARLLAATPRARRIEVIGDSISCGFGNEAPRPEERFSPSTENAWLAYGAVAARAVAADYVCIAWSGKKLWPDNSLLDLYDAILPAEPAPLRWDFGRYVPDVVVINLGTNDFFGRPAPDPAGWVDAYLAFIARIRSHYPRAAIYCAIGTMLDDYSPGSRPRSTALDCLRQIVAKANTPDAPAVRLIDFGVQSKQNGIGAQWHPSAKTHALMGEQLAAALRHDLDW